MLPKSLLTQARIALDQNTSSKKRVLEQAAALLAADPVEPGAEQIFERLLERERLGSTGLAGGVALPHARIPGTNEARGAFLRLAAAVDFDSMDGEPVDLVFALLVPEDATEEHLQLLAKLAELFGNHDNCKRLRQAESAEVVLRLLSDPADENAASGNGSGSLRLPA
jgi:PTS system nitrogen regulatory IIA component